MADPNRNRLTDIEDRPVVPKGSRGGEDWEFGAHRCELYV